jgi:transcriptional regulator with XRE-family HTH domain
MSQIDLSARSGVAQATISNLERGRVARYVTIRKLAKALGVTPADLCGDAVARAPDRLPPAPPSPLDVRLDRVHALAEAQWARERGEVAQARRWEQIAAGIEAGAEA